MDGQLVITQNIKVSFSEIARWGRFMSIVGFVSVAIVIVFAFAMLFMGNLTDETIPGFNPALFSVFYFVFGIIYLFPTVNLYKFSRDIKIAIHEDDQEHLDSAVDNLKKLFVFLGVITAIMLIFYFLIFIAAVGGGLVGAMA